MSLTELVVLKAELEVNEKEYDSLLAKAQKEIDLRITEYINYDK